ncbi:MAG: L,D-transpeptidase family protein [Azoarcus sp.]|nr:L,D-transpeptidase family protein [Azoarcus sp.]
MATTPASVFAQREANTDFLGQQKQYARVRGALLHRADALDRNLDAHGLKSTDLNILIVAYKTEAVLDIYAKKRDEASYRKLVSYPICAASGKPGPKRRQGDKQVPEGFYRIDRFNPVSNYHLSLGVDYPNAADKLKTQAPDPGGDIFIHGSCVTVGCLPMTNPKIEEIYLYAAYARNSGQRRIPVYIFPFRMTPENMKKYETTYRTQPELLAFWRNLRQGYDKFIESGKALTVSVTDSGDYSFGP